MSGISVGALPQYATMDVERSVSVDFFPTRQARAEAAIRTTIWDMTPKVQVTWLRGLADDIEKRAKAEEDWT
jgi:hypothetical protein